MRSRVTEPLLHKNMLVHTHGLPMAETLDNARNNTSNKKTSFMFRFVCGKAEILTLVNFFSKHASGVKKKKTLKNSCSCFTGVTDTEVICPDPPQEVYGLASIHQVSNLKSYSRT